MNGDIARTPLTAPRTAGNENTALIKLIAIFFMLIDHAGVVFLSPGTGIWHSASWYDVNLYYIARLLGRFGMPLFCWGIVVGTEYTRNIWYYLLRILAVGVISQPCFMLGLGESDEEVEQLLRDIRDTGCRRLTIGQYLRPTTAHLPVVRYYTPEEFADWRDRALRLGFTHAVSGPLVRSSYHADAAR